MFDTRKEFDFLLCGNCGCLQLLFPPSNMQEYYPADYYSYNLPYSNNNYIKDWIIKLRDLSIIEKKDNLISLLIQFIKPSSDLIRILRETNISKDSKILDIGSGSGTSILPLVKIGLKITGIDPYIAEPINYKGMRILKKEISQVNEKWDLIMLNHVFEHFSNPEQELLKISALLNKNGRCLIRTPVIPSFSWGKYKINWVQIDAPRHFFIHSIKSIELLADRTKFKIEKIIFDSSPFQFLGSEFYERNIAKKDRDFRMTKDNRHFSNKQLKQFKDLTKALNENKFGDQAAFILFKQ